MNTPRRLLYALLASLGLNLFLVGALVVPRFFRPKERGALHHRPGSERFQGEREARRGGGPEVDPERRLLRKLVDRLGGPESPRVAPILVKSRDARGPQQARLSLLRREAAEKLVGVPFDEAGLKAKLGEIEELEGARKKEAHRALLDLARALGDEDRVQLGKERRSLDSPGN